MTTVLLGATFDPEYLQTIRRHGWGRIWTRGRIRAEANEPWGFDNGAFVAWQQKEKFPWDRFHRRVAAAHAFPTSPVLAVLPDAVGQGMGSVVMSLRYLADAPPWPWYLAVQNGCCAQEVVAAITGDSSALATHSFHEWRGRSKVAGLFLGGTDAFKATALTWRRVATELGIRFHYGRAGTARKLRYALASKADSFDTAFPLFTRERFRAFESCIVEGDPERFMFT